MIPVVEIVASLFAGASAAGDIGVGTILAAPFLLCTLAMFVVGIAVWSYQRRRESGDTVKVDIGSAKRDMFYFLAPSLQALRKRCGQPPVLALLREGSPGDLARRGLRSVHPADREGWQRETDSLTTLLP